MTYEQQESINQLCQEAHRNALEHGFYVEDRLLRNLLIGHMDLYMAHDRNFILSQLAKVAGEIGECVSVIQKDPHMEHLPEEMADVVIRMLDLAGYLEMDLGTEIRKKMEINRNRPYKHGKTC